MTFAAGLRVLIIEDEPIVAMLTEDLLESIDCIIVATAATVSEAQAAIARGGFDVAMVDVNLGGEDGLVLADLLRSVGVPYVITSGYDPGGLAARHPEAAVLTKPYSIAALESALAGSVR